MKVRMGKNELVLGVCLGVAIFILMLAFTVNTAKASPDVDNEGWIEVMGEVTTTSAAWEMLHKIRLTYVPDPDDLTANWEYTITENTGTAYFRVYRNGVSLGGSGAGAGPDSYDETSTTNYSPYAGANPHRDSINNTATAKSGWDYEDSIIYFEIWGRVTAGAEMGVRHVRIYVYDQTAMKFDDFDNLDNVDAGSGTEDDPYILENKYINAMDGHGITIKNTTDYWIIRNSHIANTCEDNNYGIYVENASNGVIQSNTIDNCYVGIWIENSSDITVMGNLLSNSQGYGMYLRGDEDITSYYNRFENSGIHQAYDNEANAWDSGTYGNYWSEWQPPTYPEIGNTGVVSMARPIFGGFGVDRYPLVITGVGDVVLSVSPISAGGAVGSTLNYTVSVQNLSSELVTYDLITSDLNGWTISLQSSISVPAYSTRTAAMGVVISSGASVGGSNTITVTATSQLDAVVTASSTCVAIVTIVPDVGIGGFAAALAVGLGISTDSAGMLLAAMLMLCVLFPLAYLGVEPNALVAIIIVITALTTGLGWMPIWVALVVGIGFSLILARQLSNW